MFRANCEFHNDVCCSIVVRSCPTKSCAGGVERAIRWMVRNLPLVSAESQNPEYQVLHPYCAPDMNTFLSWNIGKQRACEVSALSVLTNMCPGKDAKIKLKKSGLKF